jgi:hypothetical protein
VEFRFLNFHQAIMLSLFPARFDALPASLNASYPPACLHLKGDYFPISQNTGPFTCSFEQPLFVSWFP